MPHIAALYVPLASVLPFAHRAKHRTTAANHDACQTEADLDGRGCTGCTSNTTKIEREGGREKRRQKGRETDRPRDKERRRARERKTFTHWTVLQTKKTPNKQTKKKHV